MKRILIVIIAIVGAFSFADAGLLYDVDFEAPIGNPPATGAGPKRITSIVFGHPIDAVASYEQIALTPAKDSADGRGGRRRACNFL